MRERDAAAGALLGAMLGDAMGAAFEGAPAGDAWSVGEQRLQRVMAERHLAYTDDTQMTLALAYHLVHDTPEVDPEALRDRFVERYEPWRGYGPGAHQVFDAWSDGMGLEDAARVTFPDGSYGNGAAMRVSPVAVRWPDDPERRRQAVERQARLTHVHPLGVDGAQVQAEAVAHAIRTGRFDGDAVEDLARHVSTAVFRERLARVRQLLDRDADDITPQTIAAALGNGVAAHDSVPAAVWLATTAEDPMTLVVKCLALGGDVDTITSMACAIAGAAHGRRWWPTEWIAGVEDGPHGRTECLELARQLGDARP